MHREPPLLGLSLPLASSIRPLIALGASLYFLALIAASGPHLVHHLADRHPGQPHSHADRSQPPECLVLASVQHSPLTEPLSVPAAVVLPEVEGPSDEPRFAALATLRPSFQARSPPGLPCP
jgi:hypothetical protein